ncbi:MAG: hypothetical protein IPJ51_23000 [Saprospiraceae bacterium]|nr:hypothetical protein [Saprospiraceae bacterium]
MKIFLSALAVMVLMLTIINGVRNRFRPAVRPNNTLILIGIVVCFLAIIAICLSAYFAGNSSHIPKMMLPAFILVVLIDQYRRNRRKLRQ